MSQISRSRRESQIPCMKTEKFSLCHFQDTVSKLGFKKRIPRASEGIFFFYTSMVQRQYV